jgi:hypothetical protein
MTDSKTISRDRLAELLNEDLAREYQAIIAYVGRTTKSIWRRRWASKFLT